MMNTIRIQQRHLEEFIQCEMGAQEDELTGPSPLTTVAILSRTKGQIVLNTAEEAAQVADAAIYGTFSHFFPGVAERIHEEALAFPGAKTAHKEWDKECWDDLGTRLVEATRESVEQKA